MRLRAIFYSALVIGAITIGLTATTPRTTEEVAMCCDPVPLCPGAPGCPDEPPPNQGGGGN